MYLHTVKSYELKIFPQICYLNEKIKVTDYSDLFDRKNKNVQGVAEGQKKKSELVCVSEI